MINFTPEEQTTLKESFEKIGMVILVATLRSSIDGTGAVQTILDSPTRRLEPQGFPSLSKSWTERAAGEAVRRALVSQSAPQSLADPTGFSE